jgi:hypothetical protein
MPVADESCFTSIKGALWVLACLCDDAVTVISGGIVCCKRLIGGSVSILLLFQRLGNTTTAKIKGAMNNKNGRIMVIRSI